ncbi:MAG TPA: DUF6597 domain-containing transcriptional factor, partial [Puia sp.]
MLSPTVIPVPEKLRAFVRHVWVIEPGQDGASLGEQAGRLLSIYADGCPGMIFQQSDSGLLLNQNVRKTSLQGKIARFPETSNVCPSDNEPPA